MPQKPHQKLITKVGGISVKRGWLRLFVVELIISVSLSGVLIVISCFFWMQLETQPEQRTQYCMPCLSISLNADEDNKNFGNFSIQQGDYLQCCSAADGVPKLVELSIEKKRRHTIASGFISGVPRSCELFDDQTITQGYAKVVGFTASAREQNDISKVEGTLEQKDVTQVEGTAEQNKPEKSGTKRNDKGPGNSGKKEEMRPYGMKGVMKDTYLQEMKEMTERAYPLKRN